MSSTPAPPSPPAELSPDACALKLRQLFPALFGNPPKPLKLRIQTDIQERAPGVFTKQVLSAVLRRYTGSHAYLVAITRATHRFDLDGAASAELSDEHRAAAVVELARRRANQEARRELEEQQRRNRAALLGDFERSTLTPANFCALKGIAVDELDGLLAIARREAEDERARRVSAPPNPARAHRPGPEPLRARRRP